MIIRGYGQISPLNNSKQYRPEFYDPISKERTILGYFDTFEEANRILGLAQFNYYKDKLYMLPKGLQIQSTTTENSPKFFRLSLGLPSIVTVKKKVGGNYVYLGMYTTIQDALKVKYEFFNLNT